MTNLLLILLLLVGDTLIAEDKYKLTMKDLNFSKDIKKISEKENLDDYEHMPKSISGIPIVDVTSFLVDSEGNYWMGTGSSGGIYLSKDGGKSWTPKNKNIGVSHIYKIVENKGEIFSYLTPNDELIKIQTVANYDLVIKNSLELARWYSFNKTDSMWYHYNLSDFNQKIFDAEIKREFEKREKLINQNSLEQQNDSLGHCIKNIQKSLEFDYATTGLFDKLDFINQKYSRNRISKKNLNLIETKEIINEIQISYDENGAYHLLNEKEINNQKIKHPILLNELRKKKSNIKSVFDDIELIAKNELNITDSIINLNNAKIDSLSFIKNELNKKLESFKNINSLKSNLRFKSNSLDSLYSLISNSQMSKGSRKLKNIELEISKLNAEIEKIDSDLYKFDNYNLEIKYISREIDRFTTKNSDLLFKFNQMEESLSCLLSLGRGFIDNQSTYYPMNTESVNASDPRQIIEYKKKLYVLIGANNIYTYDSKKWTKIINSYEQKILNSDLNYSIDKLFIIDGKLSFLCNGKYFIIEDQNIELFFDLSRINSYSKSKIKSLTLDSIGFLWVITDNNSILRFNNFNDKEPYLIQKCNEGSYFLQSNKNDLWIVDENKIYQPLEMNMHTTKEFEYNNWNQDNSTSLHISNNSKGDVLLLISEVESEGGSFSSLFNDRYGINAHLWNNDLKSWIPFEINPNVNEYRGFSDFSSFITSVFLSEEKDIYIGTGYSKSDIFELHCMYEWNAPRMASGLYKLKYDKKIEIKDEIGVYYIDDLRKMGRFHNPWVISIGQYNTKIYVGTSGSGIYFLTND